MTVGLLLIGFFFLKLDYSVKAVQLIGIFTVVAIIMDIAWIFTHRNVLPYLPEFFQ